MQSDPTRPALWPGNYVPRWIVDVGSGRNMGITTDDGCFVVLAQDELGYWIAATHLPVQVARRLGELSAAHGSLHSGS